MSFAKVSRPTGQLEATRARFENFRQFFYLYRRDGIVRSTRPLVDSASVEKLLALLLCAHYHQSRELLPKQTCDGQRKYIDFKREDSSCFNG